jgi:cyclopropane fatty-acyl-phospholipid synthase-like methyltransferase
MDYTPQASGSNYVFEFILWSIENLKKAALLPIPLALSWMYIRDYSVFWFPFVYLFFLVAPLVLFVGYLIVHSWWQTGGSSDWEKYVKFKDEALNAKYKGVKIPMEVVNEAYIAGELDIIKDEDDLIKLYMMKNQLFSFGLTQGHIKFFFNTFLKQISGHSVEVDHKDVGDVYNRGNDFYNWFLGETMVYTSGMWRGDKEDTLEKAQFRKLDTIAEYIHLKEGEEHLDIGCGWGTLIRHYAKKGAKSTGCTLATEQVDWGMDLAKKENVADKINYLCCDYREIPKRTNNKKYDKITCLEMAEHVGIKHFNQFLLQVNDMLKNDGIFYLQIAGLRRAWQWEDLIWGLFMDKYIFPAADASCPLAFVVSHLERAGFEVHRVENMGVHYSLTIEQWYRNWVSNKSKVIEKYSQRWYRLWSVFLAWSVIIARQGSSTVFMITCNKNTKSDKSSVVESEREGMFNRLERWVGIKPIASQQ